MDKCRDADGLQSSAMPVFLEAHSMRQIAAVGTAALRLDEERSNGQRCIEGPPVRQKRGRAAPCPLIGSAVGQACTNPCQHSLRSLCRVGTGAGAGTGPRTAAAGGRGSSSSGVAQVRSMKTQHRPAQLFSCGRSGECDSMGEQLSADGSARGCQHTPLMVSTTEHFRRRGGATPPRLPTARRSTGPCCAGHGRYG